MALFLYLFLDFFLSGTGLEFWIFFIGFVGLLLFGFVEVFVQNFFFLFEVLLLAECLGRVFVKFFG